MSRPKKGETRSVTIVCSQCGASKQRTLSHQRFPGREYCSRKCYGDSKIGVPVLDLEAYQERSAASLGERNPNWRGGMPTRKLSHRAWCRRNRESVSQRNSTRRARKMAAAGSFTLAEWEALKADHGHRCAMCRRPESEAALTRDHIIPLSKGGSDEISNIQPLCRSCNSKKKDRIISPTSRSDFMENAMAGASGSTQACHR